MHKGLAPKRTILSTAILSLSLSSYAANAINTTSDPYFTRLTGQFLVGDERQLAGFADVLQPIWQEGNKLVFVDGSVMLGRDQRETYSGGGGIRKLYASTSHEGIIGAYAFLDYFHSSHKNEFLQLNPGLEWMISNYEFRLQGYIPLNHKKERYATTVASLIPEAVWDDAAYAQKAQYFGASGHSVWDTPVALIEQVGPGFEAEGGMLVNLGMNHPSWLRVGVYHFSYNGADDINGIQANLEIPVNNVLSVMLQDNYDNQNNNRFSVGLRASFGGSTAPKNSLQNRLTSPIIRHQARQSYGEKDPTRLTFVALSSTNYSDLVWFFSEDGTPPPGASTTLESCTAENPCSTIDSPTAEQINLLTPDALLWFETGTYTIPEGSPRIVSLWDGQQVIGRTIGWLNPAQGPERPIINGGLFWGDASVEGRENSAGYVENMVVNNNNQLMSSDVSGLSFDTLIAVAVGATGDIIIKNSNTIATANSAEEEVRSIGVFTNTKATVIGGNHTARATVESGSGFAGAYGVRVVNASLERNASTIATAKSAGGANAFGVHARSKATVTGGNHTATVESGSGFANAVGVYAFTKATVTGGNHTATAESGSGFAIASGVEAEDIATVGTASPAPQTTIKVTAANEAVGVKSGSGTVVNTVISVSPSGQKCSGPTSSDGSCS